MSPESIEPVVEAYARVAYGRVSSIDWDKRADWVQESYRIAVRQQVTDILTLAHEAGWVGPDEAPF